MIGDWPAIVQGFVAASIGITLFAAGLHGYLVTAANPWQRTALVAAGLLLIDPGLVTDLIGAALAVGVVAPQTLALRGARAHTAKQVR